MGLLTVSRPVLGLQIFLAEALLIEVDEYLLSCDIEFVRWVDDYWIFGASESQVVSGLFRLGERLNQTQGLSLNPAKRRIRTCAQFTQEVLHRVDPVADLRSQIMDVVLEEDGPYAEVEDESLRGGHGGLWSMTDCL